MTRDLPPVARALAWLKERGGDGMFDSNGVVLAQGELAPFTRTTWNALASLGHVEFYGGKAQGGRGRGRLRVRDAAK